MIENAKACSLKVAINPAPCTAEVRSYPLHLCALIIVNEIEVMQLTSSNGSFSERIKAMANLFPASEIVVTLGGNGAVYRCGSKEIAVPARAVKAVDTTRAGDTFTGYFLAAKLRGIDAETAPAPMLDSMSEWSCRISKTQMVKFKRFHSPGGLLHGYRQVKQAA